MAKKNVKGVCALCKKHKVLCKSHYLGRALYELSHVDGEHPVVMTKEHVAFTPKQMWAHLLCRDCEDLFDKKGEKPTFTWINRGKGRAVDFKLLERIRLSMPLKQTKGAVVYSGLAMGVPTEALAYFALSLLWRGATKKWATLKGQTTTVDVGAFEEPIRRYLLGQTGLPDGVYVLIGVCTDLGSQGLVIPPHKVSDSRYTMYSMLVRGIWFHVITDLSASRSVAELCCVRSTQKVLHLEDCHKRFMQAVGHFKNAKVIDKKLKLPKPKRQQ